MAKADTTPAAAKRPRKTAAEKAQADLDKAQKDYDKANERLDKLNDQIDAAEAQVDEAKRYLDFVSMNPALPAQTEPAPEPETAAV
jgi:peptidoglycan hydrolase CwlO-like protein